MKVLLAPVGMQDPYGKEHEKTGFTPGSVLSICAACNPNHVILLPTQSLHGDDTYKRALETQEVLKVECPSLAVEIDPQNMEAANDYEEAMRVYGDALLKWTRLYPDAEIIVNVSSGTPAIKIACMLTLAEGRITAKAWYADDPTKTRHHQPVRLINVTFLRESSLMQRICDLLRHGQFALAKKPLEELKTFAYSLDLRQWAAYWQHLADVLELWNQRNYSGAYGRMRTLRKDWKNPPSALRGVLEHQEQRLDALALNNRNAGVLSWDLYFQARRLEAQGYLALAVETYWTAIENVTFEYAERQYPGTDTSDFQLQDVIRSLEQKNDAKKATLWKQYFSGHTVQQRQKSLRKIRNQTVHKGHVPTQGETNETCELARHWLTHFGSALPADYPLAPEALDQLANLFNADCGR